MQITVPANIGANPLTITVNGVRYELSAGETVTIPDAIAGELYRMLAAGVKKAPAVDLPFEDAGTESDVKGLDTRLAAVEAAVEVKELPDLPKADGTYSLQLVVSSGKGTLSWEAVEAVETVDSGT